MTEATGFRKLGVGTGVATPIPELLGLAQDAEALGFHSFWLSEGYHSRSTIVAATVIAAATSKIGIGLGILSPHTKHPALLAMEAASLDEVAGGRVILGIGKVLNALRKHGLEGDGATKLVKEAIEVIRGFLSGGLVQYDGASFTIPQPGSQLAFKPCRELPIYVGATGPAMLRLAGQYADGVLFNYPCTPSFIKYAKPFIEEGLKKSGRTLDKFDIAAYLLVSIDEDEKRALGAAKEFVAQRLPSRHPVMLRHAGMSEEEVSLVKRSVERLGWLEAASALDDELVRKVTIAGTPDQVIVGLRQFIGSGLQLPIVWEIIGPDRRRSLSLIAKHVMPKII